MSSIDFSGPDIRQAFLIASQTTVKGIFVHKLYMYHHPKDMEDPDYEATATLPNDHSLLQHNM